MYFTLRLFVATEYPNTIDNNVTLPQAIDLVTPVQGEVVNRLRDAIIAIESELGVDPSREFGTVRARLDALTRVLGEERIYGVIGNQNTAQYLGYQTVGAFTINSNDYVSDAYFVFQAIIETTDAVVEAQIRLFNSTTALAVAGTDLSTSSVAPTVVETSFTPDSGENIYLVQLKGSQAGGVDDFVSCKNAVVKVNVVQSWQYLG
jgi:hypothetical protein